MRYYIVLAHHEPQAFSHALTNHAITALEQAGHEVVVSDLCAMGFDPVSDRRNFTTTADEAYLKQQKEESHASEHGGFAPEIESELQKLESCDVLVFQFPLWWFGMPAILKGWCDRVLAMGRVYGGGKWYDTGIGAGKRAIVGITTGGPESMYSGFGLNPSMSTILTPIHHGIFWFNGFQPVEPMITWSPARVSDQDREDIKEAWAERLLNIDQVAPLPCLPQAAYVMEDFSFLDRHDRYLVHWQTSTSDATPPLESDWQSLALKGSLLDHNQAADGRQGWATLRCPDQPAADEVMKSLPSSDTMTWTCTLLRAGHQA